MNKNGFQAACRLALLGLMIAFGVSGIASAHHDPNIIHACAKKKKLEMVSSPSKCKKGAVPVTLATEEALESAQGSTDDLQTEIDTLSVLTRRLHGDKAAVINRTAGGGTATGTPGGYVLTLAFCDQSIGTACDENTGFVLQTGLLDETAEGSTITFDALNSSNFDAIRDLLTNGRDDFIHVRREYFLGGSSGSGGATSTGPESSYFFREEQTSTGPGYVDLAGIEIGRIEITVDRLNQFYNSSEDRTTHNIEFRVFFGLAY